MMVTVDKLRSIWRHAEHAGALKLLDDPLAAVATQEIVPGGRSRWEIQRAIKVGARGPLTFGCRTC